MTGQSERYPQCSHDVCFFKVVNLAVTTSAEIFTPVLYVKNNDHGIHNESDVQIDLQVIKVNKIFVFGEPFVFGPPTFGKSSNLRVESFK